MNITKPADLYGKKVATNPQSTVYAFWRAFVKLNNLDVSKITEVAVSGPVVGPLLAGSIELAGSCSERGGDHREPGPSPQRHELRRLRREELRSDGLHERQAPEGEPRPGEARRGGDIPLLDVHADSRRRGDRRARGGRAGDGQEARDHEVDEHQGAGGEPGITGERIRLSDGGWLEADVPDVQGRRADRHRFRPPEPFSNVAFGK